MELIAYHVGGRGVDAKLTSDDKGEGEGIALITSSIKEFNFVIIAQLKM